MQFYKYFDLSYSNVISFAFFAESLRPPSISLLVVSRSFLHRQRVALPTLGDASGIAVGIFSGLQAHSNRNASHANQTSLSRRLLTF